LAWKIGGLIGQLSRRRTGPSKCESTPAIWLATRKPNWPWSMEAMGGFIKGKGLDYAGAETKDF